MTYSELAAWVSCWRMVALHSPLCISRHPFRFWLLLLIPKHRLLLKSLKIKKISKIRQVFVRTFANITYCDYFFVKFVLRLLKLCVSVLLCSKQLSCVFFMCCGKECISWEYLEHVYHVQRCTSICLWIHQESWLCFQFGELHACIFATRVFRPVVSCRDPFMRESTLCLDTLSHHQKLVRGLSLMY